MAYFSNDYLSFFKELRENNNREWFEANKSRFKKSVEQPFLHFIGVMIDRMRAVDNRLIITPKDAIFRIYRDTRFSQDKTPYKDHLGAVIAKGGRKSMGGSGVYVQANDLDFRIYGGVYMPEKEGLQAIRNAIAADLTGFDKLINEPVFVEKYGQIQGEANKRLSADLLEAAEKQPLIFKKSFYFFHAFPPETILREDLPELCMEYYLAGKPVQDFLGKAMD